jgi:hypothetical protein
MKKIKSYLPATRETAKQLANRGKQEDLKELETFEIEFRKANPDGLGKIFQRLGELATSKTFDEMVNLKAIEIIFAYKYGKPSDKPMQSDQPTKLVIEHNVISVDEVKAKKR